MDRILLIEDDAGTQLLFSNRLHELGYEVVTASTGARGLLEARAGKFDLYLVDIGLGSGIDGYEVCRRLKAMPQIQGIPVVLISGDVKSREELHRGYEAGCQSFVMKGDPTLIEDVVRAMLRIKGLQDELAAQNRMLEERNRRLHEERQRGADLQVALQEVGPAAPLFRELAAGRPDGVLLVDAEGVVRSADLGARDILGKDVEGKHLANLAPGTGLEALVRNARTEAHEAYRFDLEWSNGAVRSLAASVIPTVPPTTGAEPGPKVVLLLDAGKRRVAGEILRVEEGGLPRRELGPLREAARRAFRPSAFVGDSRAMQAFRARLTDATRSKAPALVTGAEGTGKELAARVLHFGSTASGPFVPINCSALSPDLLESELFGCVKGAHRDALTDRPGIFLQAQHGTVFLDEVAAIPMPLQEKLIEVIETKRVRRMGAKSSEPIDVRVVAATSTDLEELTRTGRFKPELHSLLSQIDLRPPELHKGSEDITAIATHYIERYGAAAPRELSSEAAWVLGEHDWPGNAGELEGVIEIACKQAAGPEVLVSDFGGALLELYKRMSEADAIPRSPLRARRETERAKGDPLAQAYMQIESTEAAPSLEGYERKAILHALRDSNGDKLAAAKLLGIGKSTFYRKLKAHGLS